jgi:hypothetical protein
MSAPCPYCESQHRFEEKEVMDTTGEICKQVTCVCGRRYLISKEAANAGT